MPPRKRLRAVAADETVAAAPPPMTLAEAAESGTYLQILIAQRREMIRDVRDTTGPAKAAMHRQIALHSKEIAVLQSEAKQGAREDAEAVDTEWDAEAL